MKYYYAAIVLFIIFVAFVGPKLKIPDEIITELKIKKVKQVIKSYVPKSLYDFFLT